MYIALWFEEVWVPNPYYQERGCSGEPAEMQETRQNYRLLPTIEILQEFVVSHQNKKNLKFFKAEEIKPKINVTVEVTV